MSSENGKQQDAKPLPENSAQIRTSDTGAYGKAPLRSFEGGSHQSDYLSRDQPYLSTPIVTTGGSDHSQQENFPLSGDSRVDPFLEELGFHSLRQQGWPNPSQHMRSPRADIGIPMKGTDPLSPGSTHSSHPGGRTGRPPKFDGRQESEMLHAGVGALRNTHYGGQQLTRQPYNSSTQESLGPGRFARESLGAPRSSGDYMAGLTFPDDPLLAGRNTPGNRLDPGHRMFEEGMGPDDIPGCMPSLDSRGFMHEDDILFPSTYGGQDGFNRLSMQPSSHTDPRGERHIPSPGYMGKGVGRTRSGGILNGQPIDEQVHARRASQGDSRDALYTQLGPLHMHRSASEGLIRGPYPGGHPNEPPVQSPENASMDQRARSGSTMQEEGSLRPGGSQDQSRGLLAARMNETPDFAMIYAFLGSMFDPVCHMIDHADVMNQMNAVDRETTNLILANCVHNLSIPEFAEHVLYHSLRQASSSSRPRAPGAGNPGFAQGTQNRHAPLPQ